MTTENRLMYDEVLSLLGRHAANVYAREEIAPLVAAKSLEMNHLYQDLGLKNRTEMGKFMKHHFPTLAARKPKEKLWKKYLYDSIGEIAPACATCDDQLTCFACMVGEMSA
ncbi:MAG TPA: hydrogenase [Epsilonproteobacteria bacterium]|nr:hydrogenase [Campylobacterota bacterium]HHD72571.1 hydrogenase [Campylobacterota bacterium]